MQYIWILCTKQLLSNTDQAYIMYKYIRLICIEFVFIYILLSCLRYSVVFISINTWWIVGVTFITVSIPHFLLEPNNNMVYCWIKCPLLKTITTTNNICSPSMNCSNIYHLLNSIGTCWTSVKYIDESLASPFPSSVQGWLLCVYQTNTKSLIFIDTDHTTDVHQ